MRRMAARASGVDTDFRRDHPHDEYDGLHFKVAVEADARGGRGFVIYVPVYAGEYTAAECPGRDQYTIDGKKYEALETSPSIRYFRPR